MTVSNSTLSQVNTTPHHTTTSVSYITLRHRPSPHANTDAPPTRVNRQAGTSPCQHRIERWGIVLSFLFRFYSLDANTFFITSILKKQGLLHLFASIHSNPTHIDPISGTSTHAYIRDKQYESSAHTPTGGFQVRSASSGTGPKDMGVSGVRPHPTSAKVALCVL